MISLKRASEQVAAQPYGESFYESHIAGSQRSAKHILGYLYRFFAPVSVVDLGCGRGAWLKVSRELGSSVVHGYDGFWNTQADMLDPKITFTPVDLERELQVYRRYDLAISLEVAEHLKPESAASFARNLSRLSDVILFSAAIPGQGGTRHLNEQYQSYWGALFSCHRFAIFDMFRPVFWGEAEVELWYRQNAFLYVRQEHPLAARLRKSAIFELTDPRFMDCVHPELYEAKLSDLALPPTVMGVKQHIRDFLPSLARSVSRRVVW